MAKGKKTDVTFEVEEIYGYLNKKKDKVLVRVSWNGKPAQCEIRRCWVNSDGELGLGKGIPLSDDEFEELIKLFKKKPKPVDFDEVFRSSQGVMEKRNQGFRTVDGFPILRRRRPE